MNPFDFLRFGAYALLLLGMLAAVGTFVFALFMLSLNIYRNSRQAELRRERERGSWEPQPLALSYSPTLNEPDAVPTHDDFNPFLPPNPPAPLPTPRLEPGAYPPSPFANVPFVTHDFPR